MTKKQTGFSIHEDIGFTPLGDGRLEQKTFRKVTCCWSVHDEVPRCPFRNERDFSSSYCNAAPNEQHTDVDTPDQIPRNCPLWTQIITVGIIMPPQTEDKP